MAGGCRVFAEGDFAEPLCRHTNHGKLHLNIYKWFFYTLTAVNPEILAIQVHVCVVGAAN